MKKWVISLGMVGLVFGCSGPTNDDATNSNGSNVEIDAESQTPDETNENTEIETDADLSLDDSETSGEEITFVAQYVETEAGL